MNRVKAIIAAANFTGQSSPSPTSSVLDPEDPGGVRVSLTFGVFPIQFCGNSFFSQVFPLSRGYTQWETDEVIAHELYRNLALAMGEWGT